MLAATLFASYLYYGFKQAINLCYDLLGLGACKQVSMIANMGIKSPGGLSCYNEEDGISYRRIPSPVEWPPGVSILRQQMETSLLVSYG